VSAVERFRSIFRGVESTPFLMSTTLLFSWYVKLVVERERPLREPLVWAVMYVFAEARRASRVQSAAETEVMERKMVSGLRIDAMMEFEEIIVECET
jgi:hypothetical protein